MKSAKPLDFVLTFDQSHWQCYNDTASFKADTIDEIDQKIKAYLQNRFPGQQIKVNMHFDFNRFPTWMRQYMAHYFNREIIFGQ